MSCASQTYNCTLTWIVENFHVFLFQNGDHICVPRVEVETLNNIKVVLGLRKNYSNLIYTIKKVADGTTPHQTPVDIKVSVEATDGSLHFSKAESGVKFGNNMAEVIKDVCPVDEIAERHNFFLQDGVFRIRIEMRFCDSNPLVLCSQVRTKIKIEKCSFTWSLKNLSKAENGESLSFPIPVHLRRSPKFTLQILFGKDSSSVQLKIIKKSSREDRLGDEILLDDSAIFLCCNIRVIRNHRKALEINKSIFFSSQSGNQIETITPPEYDDDLPSYAESSLWCNLPKEFQMNCKFLFSDGTYGSLIEQLDYSYPSSEIKIPIDSKESVLGLSMLKEQKFMDVTLKAGNKSFNAHKAVLSSASPVFYAMFNHDMEEQSSGIVSFDDISPDTLDNMIKYMYSNVLDDGMEFETLADLLSAADKYQMYVLKHLCSARLITRLCSKNVCRVLYLAHLHEDEEMKLAAKSLFAKDPTAVLDSKEWAKLMDNCIRGAACVQPSAPVKIVRRLQRSLSQIRHGIASSKIFPFPSRR